MSKSTKSKGAKSKTATGAIKCALQAKAPHTRTYKIEQLLIARTLEGAPISVREIENALPEVKAVRAHIAHLYAEQLIQCDTNVRPLAYSVRANVLSHVQKTGAPTSYRAVNEMNSIKSVKAPVGKKNGAESKSTTKAPAASK